MSCRHCFANQSFQFLNSMPAIMLLFLLLNPNQGHVKLMQRVKIAHSFLQSVSNQFHVIILSLPM